MLRQRGFCALLLLPLISFLPHTGVAGDILRDWILPSVPKDAHIVAYLPCPLLGFEEDVVCAVTEKNDTSRVEGLTRLLTIYQIESARLRKVFEFEVEYALNSIGMVGRDTLQAMWVTGSAYNLTLFRKVAKGTIKKVFEGGVSAYPELVDLDDDGIPEVIVGQWEWFQKQGHWERAITKAAIFRLERETYKLVRTVPWTDRHRSMSRRK